MAFWWPVLVLAFAYALCRFLLMLIPPDVPSLDVDASDVMDDGYQTASSMYLCEKLQNLVNDALDKGAEIIARGSFGNLGEDAVDHFFPPTVIVNVNHGMKLMQEKAFGPIMPIMKFTTDEEVIKLANDSKYGLGCAVFSGSQKLAKEIASQIHCGVMAINDFASTYMRQYPIAENGFEFQESLVEALYGLNIWDRLRALVNVLKFLSEQNSPSSIKRKTD